MLEMLIEALGCGAIGLSSGEFCYPRFVLWKFRLGSGFSSARLDCLRQTKVAKMTWIGSLVGAEVPGLERKELEGGSPSLLGQQQGLQANYVVAVVSVVYRVCLQACSSHLRYNLIED